jgi:hypothetical protein
VLLIDAEDDGLLEAVAAFLQEVGDLLCDELGAVVDDQRAVEILGVVDAVLDLLAVAVESGPSPAGSLLRRRSIWTLTTL